MVWPARPALGRRSAAPDALHQPGHLPCFSALTEQRTYRRHLRRAEVPHVCRIFPLPLLERIYGRVLIFKAFKPVSAALPVPQAA
jgi:hypothetical protein